MGGYSLIIGFIVVSILISVTQVIIAYRTIQEVYQTLRLLKLEKEMFMIGACGVVEEIKVYERLIQLNTEYMRRTKERVWGKIVVQLMPKHTYEISSA